MANRNTRGQAIRMQREKKKKEKVAKETYTASLKEGKNYTKAQLAAKKRIAQKAAGTYQKPKTAQELAKDRLKVKAQKEKKTRVNKRGRRVR